MKKNKIIKICFVMALLVLISAPFSARASFMDDFFNDFESYMEESHSETTTDGNGNQVYISNDVSVSASSGGNVVSGGEVKEGETRVKIKTETVVNGKVIDPVDIDTKANEASVKSVIRANGDDVQVEREIKIDSESVTENFEVDLENSEESSEEAVMPNPQIQAEEPGEVNNPPERNNLQEQNEKEEKMVKKTFTVLNNWLSDFTNNFKSFFQSIFSIF